ncbi:hypothetical protein [Sphingopyxis sp.]|uniref:hypothetical protein n=1 Tax=Sphingopyxis sp. TaxID=1908224 RepID=UPI002585D13D|nr:hypothetical protein [Sphingopyxis sp.]
MSVLYSYRAWLTTDQPKRFYRYVKGTWGLLMFLLWAWIALEIAFPDPAERGTGFSFLSMGFFGSLYLTGAFAVVRLFVAPATGGNNG